MLCACEMALSFLNAMQGCTITRFRIPKFKLTSTAKLKFAVQEFKKNDFKCKKIKI